MVPFVSQSEHGSSVSVWSRLDCNEVTPNNVNIHFFSPFGSLCVIAAVAVFSSFSPPEDCCELTEQTSLICFGCTKKEEDVAFFIIIIIIIIIIELTQSKTILENTAEIEPQTVAFDFKNLSQYSSRFK